jgi:hypothetical protein
MNVFFSQIQRDLLTVMLCASDLFAVLHIYHLALSCNSPRISQKTNEST